MCGDLKSVLRLLGFHGPKNIEVSPGEEVDIFSASGLGCNMDGLRTLFDVNTRHLLRSIKVDGLPEEGPIKVISVGAGLCEELASLACLFGDRLEYTAIDINPFYCKLAQMIYAPLSPKIKRRFIPIDATQLFDHRENGYYEQRVREFMGPQETIIKNDFHLVILRHPYFDDESQPQYNDFEKIVRFVIGQLAAPEGQLFATFYEEKEARIFLKLIEQSENLALESRQINEKFDSVITQVQTSNGPRLTYSDGYQVQSKVFLPLSIKEAIIKIDAENNGMVIYQKKAAFFASQYATEKHCYGPYLDHWCTTEDPATQLARYLTVYLNFGGNIDALRKGGLGNVTFMPVP